MSSIEKAIDKLGRKADQKLKTNDKPRRGEDVERTNESRRDLTPELVINLDKNHLIESGYLCPDGSDSRSKLAEEYRILKRPLLKNAFSGAEGTSDLSNLIVITSALQGEGKSFTAINLAISLSQELDTSVLLVDGDVIKRSITNIFGLASAKGLTDILMDNGPYLDELIVGTDVAKFNILPAGTVYGNSTELLSSEKMRILANKLSTDNSDCIILLDAPPLLATSEAAVLLNLAGQILLVVEEGKTPISSIESAVSMLGKDKIIGMVLNKSLQSSKGGYGYYGGDSGGSS